MKRKITQVFRMLLIVLLAAAILIGGLALNIWYYTAIFGSGLPAWAKFLLAR